MHRHRPSRSSAVSAIGDHEGTTALGYHSATITGSLNPNGSDTHYYFEYGLTTSYGTDSPAYPGNPAGIGTSPVSENASLSGLKAGTTYHYRLVASNYIGTTAGADHEFKTPIPPPTVTSESPTNIGDTSANLNGSVNPNGFATTYQFQYWQAGKPGEVTDLPVTPESIGSGEANVKISKNALGLEPFTEYKWRIVAANAGGTTNGPESSVAVGPFLALQSTPGMSGDEIGLQSVACPSASNCIAVGLWGKEKALEGHDYSQLWNGREWVIKSVPTPSEGSFGLQAIACSSTTACTAIADPSALGGGSTRRTPYGGTEPNGPRPSKTCPCRRQEVNTS